MNIFERKLLIIDRLLFNYMLNDTIIFIFIFISHCILLGIYLSKMNIWIFIGGILTNLTMGWGVFLSIKDLKRQKKLLDKSINDVLRKNINSYNNTLMEKK